MQAYSIFLYTLLPSAFFIYSLINKNYSVLFNSALTLIIIILFCIFAKRKSLFQKNTCNLIIIFILLSLFSGNSLNLYYLIPYWDRILHFLSGFLTARIGLEIYIKMKGDRNNSALMILFCFLFASACASVWEVYEFFSDMIFKTNAQNNSLKDTMWDIILGTLSSFLYILIIKEKNKKI